MLVFVPGLVIIFWWRISDMKKKKFVMYHVKQITAKFGFNGPTGFLEED